MRDVLKREPIFMKYNTKNKAIVKEFMKERCEEHLSIDSIFESLQQKGQKVPLASLYRIMDELVDEGAVRKYSIDRSSAACFQYASEGCHEHFHLICSGCGKLIHLECDEVSHLLSHIESEHDFKIDMSRVNFYGLCKDCQNRD